MVMCGADFYKVDVDSMKMMLEVKSSSIFQSPGQLCGFALQNYLNESLGSRFVALACTTGIINVFNLESDVIGS